jgi:hypothetical protein
VTRPLIVAVAHGLDLMTLLLALQVYSLDGEWNVIARTGGIEAAVLLKVAGTVALACLVVWRLDSWPRFHRFALPIAAGAGIVGAAVNTIALHLAA